MIKLKARCASSSADLLQFQIEVDGASSHASNRLLIRRAMIWIPQSSKPANH
jgi:hypothetical protein